MVATNIIGNPGQVGFVPDPIAILTVGTTVGFTVIVIPEDVAVVGTAQDELEVNIQVTTSPFANVDVVKVVPPAPALTPFTCHW